MKSKVEEIQKRFISRGLTLAVAESCTGGQLSAALTSISGSSKYFLGSVISYNASVKVKILKVPQSSIQGAGEVSELVAQLMATGVRTELGSDWSVAITGVAGPTGGTVDKPVGMVCFGVSGPDVLFTETKNFGSRSRDKIQQASIEHALDLLIQYTV
ncbi:MAG: CinA family protein [Bdellovibrionales bacterium]|nr:CinA family protein [Bdellovibrionales bacterium]